VEISSECRDLLCRTLVADPAQRISMSDIQRHRWFLTNLPPEAVSMNDNYLADDDFSGVQTEEEIKTILHKVGWVGAWGCWVGVWWGWRCGGAGGAGVGGGCRCCGRLGRWECCWPVGTRARGQAPGDGVAAGRAPLQARLQA
jgi:hypothetical protein